jgi:hypothetical protein
MKNEPSPVFAVADSGVGSQSILPPRWRAAKKDNKVTPAVIHKYVSHDVGDFFFDF